MTKKEAIKIFDEKNIRTIWNDETEEWYFVACNARLELEAKTGKKVNKKPFAYMKRLNLLLLALVALLVSCNQSGDLSELKKNFVTPPEDVKPGVYWYFMDGNLSKESMTKDLEAMKEAGIGHVVYLEVNVGIPRGPVDFLSEQWKELFKHAVEECERLGIAITLGVGPGWTGSGGPWVNAAASMQHLVSSSTEVTGGKQQTINLPKPFPKPPYFGEGGFTPQVRKQWEDFYKDVAVLAFPTPQENSKIEGTDEKALYYRAPYSSVPGVKQFLATSANYPAVGPGMAVSKRQIVDLTDKLMPDGNLIWEVPAGKWTIMRFGARNNGAVTRPAPLPGVGLEADKLDTAALNAHLDVFTGELFRFIGKRDTTLPGGLKMLHMDSWEMGAQNWTADFEKEFTRRRGYDPKPFYPVYAGVIIENREISERFLWDLRVTLQEMVLENHAGHIKSYAHCHGMGLSIEPYDMNPTADLELGAVADVPMCEFWSPNGYNTSFSAMEGTSIAHLKGQPVVPAESFTAAGDGWKQHPASMKDQTDWAFAAGINRLVYHTFQHQYLDDSLRPGMTMGPYGVHWDRNQTWWPMVKEYHRYVSRCQYMLRQGRTVAEILYLTPEGAPHVFRAPKSALAGIQEFLPDRKGYNFDGCPPSLFAQARTENGQIVFPSGATYNLLVLPDVETMTPELLAKIKELILNGATVIGLPPLKSPSLVNYPSCDTQVAELVQEIWGSTEIPEQMTTRTLGKGKIIWGKDVRTQVDNLYTPYELTARIFSTMGIPEDFSATGQIRYTHRKTDHCDIYFVANRLDKKLTSACKFRISEKIPELWDPLTGKIRELTSYVQDGQHLTIDLEFEPHQSFFIIFNKKGKSADGETNFATTNVLATLDSPWEVSFDPAWGGPEKATFNTLTDWSRNSDPGIKYYSGTAVYKQNFDMPETSRKHIYMNLGKVKNIARVWLNGKDMGIVWTTPWQVEITGTVKEKDNELKIEVINLWANRLIGDELLPDDGIQNGQWPKWLLNGETRKSGRYTFATQRHYTKDSPLLESGLMGPVQIIENKY